MKNLPAALILFLGSMACDDEPKLSTDACDGRLLSEGQEVTAQLTELGYLGYIDSGNSLSDAYQMIISDDKEWAEMTAAWGSKGALSPDFTTQAVFVNAWVNGGCGEQYLYGAWQWDETLRVRAEYSADSAVCDGYFPQAELLLQSLHGADDLGLCQ